MEVGFCFSRRCAFYSAYRSLASRADVVCPDRTPHIETIAQGHPTSQPKDPDFRGKKVEAVTRWPCAMVSL